MDRKLIPIVAALMFFGSLVALQGVFGQTDVVTIDYPQHHKTDKYKGTQFPHKKHADAVKPCQMCHHKWYKGEKVKKCVDCPRRTPRSPLIRPFTTIARIVTWI